MLKKIFKTFALLIIIWVVLLMSFRIYTVNHYPPAAEGIVATDALKAAYAAGTLDAETWEARTLYDDNQKSKFFSHQPIYIPSEETLIVTLRYNNSLLAIMAEDFGFAETNGRDLPLDVSLFADGHERIHPSTYTFTTAFGLYSYRRYVFEGVSADMLDALYIDVYYADNADYTVSPYASLELRDASREPEVYKLTAADKKVLAE